VIEEFEEFEESKEFKERDPLGASNLETSNR